jgi:hypothetical protein
MSTQVYEWHCCLSNICTSGLGWSTTALLTATSGMATPVPPWGATQTGRMEPRLMSQPLPAHVVPSTLAAAHGLWTSALQPSHLFASKGLYGHAVGCVRPTLQPVNRTLDCHVMQTSACPPQPWARDACRRNSSTALVPTLTATVSMALLPVSTAFFAATFCYQSFLSTAPQKVPTCITIPMATLHLYAGSGC